MGKLNTTDPVEFIERFCINRDGTPLQLHETQKLLLRDSNFMNAACCGRQWGKSVVYSGKTTWFACTHSNRECYIIAPTVDQSRIIFNEVANQFRNTELRALVQGHIKEYPFPQITLKNGTKIHGRGANNPQFIRGKPIHFGVLDEAAFFKDGVIKSVIEPMFTVTRGSPDASLNMISTPFGMGEFYDYCQKAKDSKSSSFHHYTSLDNPYANREFLDEIKDYYGETSLLWLSEYMGEFVDGDLAVFPWSNIKWAVDHHPYHDMPQPPERGHRYVQGVDLANVRDYFVSTVLDCSNPGLNPLVRYDRSQKQGYAAYKGIVRNNYKTYNQARTLVDATSLGESVAEDLRDIGAEGYKFGGSTAKYEVVQELARMLSEHRITIPNDRAIVDELRYFQYEITPSKKLKMEAARGHDDIVMSLALAAHLACLPSFIGFFEAVDMREPLLRGTVNPPRPSTYYDPFKEAFNDNTDN